MVFKNIRVFFLGSGDFPKDAKLQAASDSDAVLEAGRSGFEKCRKYPFVPQNYRLMATPRNSHPVIINSMCRAG